MNKRGSLTWFRNISFHLHPFVGGNSVLGFAGIVWVGPVEVVGAPELGEVVTIEAVARDTARVTGGRWHRSLKVGVERSRLSEGAVTVVTHLTWENALSVNFMGIKMDFVRGKSELKVVLTFDWKTFNHKYYQPAVYFERKLPKTLQQGTIKTNSEEEGSTWKLLSSRHNIDFTQEYFWSNRVWHEWCWRMW